MSDPEVAASLRALAIAEATSKSDSFVVFFGSVALLTALLVLPDVGIVRTGIWLGLYLLLFAVRRVAAPALLLRPPERTRAAFFVALLNPALLGLLALLCYDSLSQSRFVALTVIAVGVLMLHTSLLYGLPALHRCNCLLVTIPFALAWLLSGHELGPPAAAFMIAATAAQELAAAALRRGLEPKARLQVANRRLVRRLAEEVSALETLNRSKTSLLAAACHDLRQPAHAMGFLIDAMLADEPTGVRRDRLRSLQRSNVTLTGMLATLMDLTRLDGGGFGVERTVVDLSAVLDEAWLQFHVDVARKGLAFEIDHCDLHVLSDPYLLRRIVFNLVSNAIKYSERGHVRIAVAEQDGRALLSVEDTGIGISHEDQGRVFEEYTRLGRSAEGLGIGLSVVRRASDLLQHPLRLVSEPGVGTTVEIGLAIVPGVVREPARDSVTGSVGPAQRAAGEGVLVALAEDDVESRCAATDLRQSWGYEVVAGSGLTSLMQQLDDLDGREPTMLLTDLHLGRHENGFQIIDAVRARPGLGELPAMMVTGDLGYEVTRKARERQILLLHKPVPSRALRDAVETLMSPAEKVDRYASEAAPGAGVFGSKSQ